MAKCWASEAAYHFTPAEETSVSGLALGSYPFPIVELQEVAPGSPALISRLTLCWVFILPPPLLNLPNLGSAFLCLS